MKPNYLFPILHLLPYLVSCFHVSQLLPARLRPQTLIAHRLHTLESTVPWPGAGRAEAAKNRRWPLLVQLPKNCSKSSPGCIWAGEYGLQRQERSFNGGCAGLQRLSSPQVVLQVPVPSCALLPNVLHHWIAASRQVMTECYVKCCPGLSKC